MDDRFKPDTEIGTLVHLIQECSEVIHAATKCMLYGYEAVNPLLPEFEQVKNIDYLFNEMADARSAFDSFLEKYSGVE